MVDVENEELPITAGNELDTLIAEVMMGRKDASAAGEQVDPLALSLLRLTHYQN
jgi:hypothetical protein